MKIYKPIGSKDRLVEIFQKVNNVKLNESMLEAGGQLNPQNVLNMAYNELKNKRLKIQHSKTQASGDETFVELTCLDSQGNNITFTFKVNASEGDQEGVYDVNNVTLDRFSFDSASGEESTELAEDGLRQFNQQFGGELFDVIQNYVDIESPEPENMEELEEAIKLIDAIKKDSYPFGGGKEDMQTGVNYADEKPTNSKLRVNAPELKKTVQEYDKPEQKLIMQPMASTSNIQENDIVNQEINRFKKSIVKPETSPFGKSTAIDYNHEPEIDNEPMPNISKEKRDRILTAYNNIIKNSGNPNYAPTMPEVQAELDKMMGVKPKPKMRVLPKEAEPFLEDDEMIPNKNLIKPNKQEIILKAFENLFNNGNKRPTVEEMRDEIQRITPEINLASVNEEKGEYPEPIGREFSPDSDYPKTKKKHRTKKIKIKEEEQNVGEGVNLAMLDDLGISYNKKAEKQATSDINKDIQQQNKGKDFDNWKHPIHTDTVFPDDIQEEEIIPDENPEHPLAGILDIDSTEDLSKQNTGKKGVNRALEPNGEENIEQIAKEKEEAGEEIPGGKGEGKSPLDFDPEQIKKGMKVEMEHTEDPMISLEIALDHLAEDPEYYTEKETPEASAQFGAAKDTEEQDDETADELLGFKPHNVGDYEGSEIPHTPETPEMPKDAQDGEDELGEGEEKIINVKSIGVDDWSRGIYKDVDTGKKYVDVDGQLHTMTDYGEPDMPLRNVKPNLVQEDKESELKQRDPATWHQIQVAKKTVKMPGAMANVMGGMMSREDAMKILKQRGIKVDEEVTINGSSSTGVSASSNATGENNDYKKYEEYKKKPYDTLSDMDKKQYFELFNKFEGK